MTALPGSSERLTPLLTRLHLSLSLSRRAKQEKKAVSVGYLGNVVDLW